MWQESLEDLIGILNTKVSFLEPKDAILSLQGLNFWCTFRLFCKYTLHACYVFNDI